MTEIKDSHSKIVLAIIGIVIVFGIVVILLSKQQETRAGQPISYTKGTIAYPKIKGETNSTCYTFCREEKKFDDGFCATKEICDTMGGTLFTEKKCDEGKDKGIDNFCCCRRNVPGVYQAEVTQTQSQY